MLIRDLAMGRRLMEGAPDDGAPGDPPAPATPPTPPATPPADTVTIDRSEHDRIQAENRRLKKAAKDREEQEAQAKAQREADAARAAGDFDKALGIERAEKERLQGLLQQRNARDAVVAEAAARGLNAEQARALARLTETSGIETDDLGEVRADQVATAVEATLQAYPNMFKAGPATPPSDDGKGGKPRRQAGPATPTGDGGGKPEGYVSPEEYTATPQEVRHTAEFQARVARSRPYWPKVVPANSFASDPG